MLFDSDVNVYGDIEVHAENERANKWQEKRANKKQQIINQLAEKRKKQYEDFNQDNLKFNEFDEDGINMRQNNGPIFISQKQAAPEFIGKAIVQGIKGVVDLNQYHQTLKEEDERRAQLKQERTQRTINQVNQSHASTNLDQQQQNQAYQSTYANYYQDNDQAHYEESLKPTQAVQDYDEERRRLAEEKEARR